MMEPRENKAINMIIMMITTTITIITTMKV